MSLILVSRNFWNFGEHKIRKFVTHLAFSLLRVSICSAISATASLCFFRIPAMLDSCWMLASSMSRRSLVSSDSRFLLSSICAAVAPPASSKRSVSSSKSRARSLLCFSALARAWRSASSSSSSSSMRPCNSLICFWSLETTLCSSSNLLVRDWMSLSLRWMVWIKRKEKI